MFCLRLRLQLSRRVPRGRGVDIVRHVDQVGNHLYFVLGGGQGLALLLTKTLKLQ